ncbi:MAG: hypothetical protein ACR2OH_01280 [Microthrixaceae bacterium]
MQFFDDPGMDFSVRCLLSGVRDGTAEVGEILATIERVEDGDADSWLNEFCGLGRRLVAQAEESSGAGLQRTAWGQALRAANYLFGGAWWAPATHRSGEVDVLWQQHRHAWDLAVSLWPTPAVAEAVPSPVGDLPGYRFTPGGGETARGVVLMIQGLDTPLSDAAMTGLSEGLRRGWEVALVEGPGQGAALLRDGLNLADSWRGVVDAASEWARGGSAGPLVAMGVNHGSWFVLDAMVGGLVADAVVLDPGVVDLATDQQGATDDPIAAAKLLMATGTGSVSDALAVMDHYRFDPSALAAVAVPTFVADAESAESFAGQSQVVAENLGGDVHLERFSDASGAGLDCEIAAPQVRNAAVYDWLNARVAKPKEDF